MRSDIDIKRDVEAELRWNPDIDATDIAVAVKNGVVTLTGFVRSYAQKLEAEQTAKRQTDCGQRVYRTLGCVHDRHKPSPPKWWFIQIRCGEDYAQSARGR